ncbi:MAG TPA: F0F1 ATP synthase subunit epsilon [Candidatus Lustribacter sp.]|nr:F0F1 ATP synthase subunit epsilon [Candidatus Lustribacter sp.]
MSELQVEMVAADRLVWSGTASMVRARSVDGDLGILPGHAPLLALLGSGEVSVKAVSGPDVSATIDTGFLSVEHDRVTIVAERVTTSAG